MPSFLALDPKMRAWCGASLPKYYCFCYKLTTVTRLSSCH